MSLGWLNLPTEIPDMIDMTMTTCKQCGSPLSTSAIACSTCGAKTRKRTPYSVAEKLLLVTIIVLVVLAVVGRVLAR
jgi:uncharacterized OB-fold protein